MRRNDFYDHWFDGKPTDHAYVDQSVENALRAAESAGVTSRVFDLTPPAGSRAVYYELTPLSVRINLLVEDGVVIEAAWF